MRTTVTLDDDVARIVEQARRERGIGLSAALNEVVRRGAAQKVEGQVRFVQSVSSLGEQLIPIDDVAGALEVAEGDERVR